MGPFHIDQTTDAIEFANSYPLELPYVIGNLTLELDFCTLWPLISYIKSEVPYLWTYIIFQMERDILVPQKALTPLGLEL